MAPWAAACACGVTCGVCKHIYLCMQPCPPNANRFAGTRAFNVPARYISPPIMTRNACGALCWVVGGVEDTEEMPSQLVGPVSRMRQEAAGKLGDRDCVCAGEWHAHGRYVACSSDMHACM